MLTHRAAARRATTPAEATKTPEANLLLFPLAAARSLLGHAVHTTPDGAWTIADQLAPARGACGEEIVDSVFVGHGKRDLVAAAPGTRPCLPARAVRCACSKSNRRRQRPRFSRSVVASSGVRK